MTMPEIQRREQVAGGPKRYGDITDAAELRAKLEQNGEPIGSDAIWVEE